MKKEMSQRPKLEKTLDSATFSSFYYLKKELVDFCKENRLSTFGSKAELKNRITLFLDTGKEEKPSFRTNRKINRTIDELDEETVIESNIVCSEMLRSFFREKIGKNFSFNVSFQKWVKANAGKTYGDAIQKYGEIIEEKKKTKTEIDSQFEYNKYIRDFFIDNQEKNLCDAIVCWNYKKNLPGSHSYEASDLIALEE